jgi:hypothetical protein
MKGRRGSLPPKRRGRPTQSLNPRQRKELRRAHRLMESGEHANAAELIERIAHTIYDLHMLRLAPRLYIQAGRARILAGEVQNGRELLEQGLEIWASSGRKVELVGTSQRLLHELHSLGFSEAAVQLEEWLKKRYPKQDLPEAETPMTPGEHRRLGLPLQCAECDAPLHPDDLDWKGSQQGECPYCGSFIQ